MLLELRKAGSRQIRRLPCRLDAPNADDSRALGRGFAEPGADLRRCLWRGRPRAPCPGHAAYAFLHRLLDQSFVALAFARLAAEGRIELDWTLAELAPDIAFPPEVRAREVTLRHLLSHSHGLVVPGIEFRLAYSGQHDRATLWRLLRGARPNPRAPLGSFHYGNLGYNVAAMLIERRLGRRWQDLLDELVLRPMRLNETFAQGLARSRAPRAAPYASLAPGGPERLRLAKTDAICNAGGHVFQRQRHGIWVALQLAANAIRPGWRFPPASSPARTGRSRARSCARPFARTGYGLGWYSGDYRGETLYHSFGSFSGARAHTSFCPRATSRRHHHQ